MTSFDYAVLAALAASCLLGLWRGLISEVLALVAWVAGFFAARQWAEAVGAQLVGVVRDPSLRYAAGFALVLVGVLLAVGIVRLVMALLMKAAGLGLTDRLLGAGFGILRGTLIVFVVVLLGGLTGLPKTAWWREAKLAPPLETAAIAVKPWLPVEVGKRIRYR